MDGAHGMNNASRHNPTDQAERIIQRYHAALTEIIELKDPPGNVRTRYYQARRIAQQALNTAHDGQEKS